MFVLWIFAAHQKNKAGSNAKALLPENTTGYIYASNQNDITPP